LCESRFMRATEHDITCVAELNADVIICGAWPEPGHEVLADVGDLVLGSSGAIFAADCVRLGLRVGICGLLGTDKLGAFVCTELERAGIDTSGVRRRDDVRTGLTVSITGSGDRAMVTFPGAMGMFRLEDVDWELIRASRHVHVSSPFLQEALLPDLHYLLSEARRVGVSTSLDPGWAPSARWQELRSCLEVVDVLLPNEEEALELTGTSTTMDALAHLSRLASVAVIKRGARGALAGFGGDVYEAAGVEANLLDATGAGDGFDAAFIWAWLSGRAIPDCLHIGCIAGSRVVEAAGGTASFPTHDNIEMELSRHAGDAAASGASPKGSSTHSGGET
jgi:sugar/nucleoside kinase (ribokinase family)